MKSTTHRLLSSLLAMVLCSLTATAQHLTLNECEQMARDNYPVAKQRGLVDLTEGYTLNNIAKKWLPQVSVSGDFAGFTDIIKQPSMIEMKNYVASGMLSVQQNIYDGGSIAAGKRVAKAQAEVNRRQVDVSIYDVLERVDQMYFGILLIDKQINQYGLLKADLDVCRKNVESLKRGGLANESDIDAIAVEQVKVAQQTDAAKALRASYAAMLGTLIGKDVTADATLDEPMTPTTVSTANYRPELSYYDAQNSLIDEQLQQLNTRLRPTLSLFGAGMIHSRVTSMLNNGVLLGGISLKWNIGALYTRKNDIQKLQAQKSQNEVAREAFLFGTRLRTQEAEGKMESLRAQIKADAEIVALRQRIQQKSERKVQMGTESVNELVRQTLAVSQARQQMALHQVQLLQQAYSVVNINNSNQSNSL